MGGREIGFLFGQYKRLRNQFTAGVLTGKSLRFGGSLARTEATGYGLLYFTQEMLRCLKNDSIEGKTIVVSGSGNVAIYAAQKAQQLGGKPIAMSDSAGYIIDRDGIKLDVVKQIKEVERAVSKSMRSGSPAPSTMRAAAASGPFPVIIALPCATQNELDLDRRQGVGCQRRPGRGRGREHAQHHGSHQLFPG